MVAPEAKRVQHVEIYPYSAVGRLFFRQGNELLWGTACVVSARNVFTAARNLWDNGRYSTDIEFWLQYDQDRSLGVYTPDANAIFVPEAWKRERTTTFDYSVFRTTADLPVAKSGRLVFRASATVQPQTACTALGYPGGPFDSAAMWECRGTIDYAMTFLSQMQNDFHAGAGGGPWLVQDSELWNIVGSTGQLLPEYTIATSPPFDATVEALFNQFI